MEGSLKEIHLGGLLRLLTLHRFTGALHLEGEGQKGVIYLKTGRILGALRTPYGTRVGQLLIQSGYLTEETLQGALGKQKNDPQPRLIGYYLTNGDKPTVNPELFRQVLETQSTENIVALLRLSSGTFRFEDGVTGFEDFPTTMCTENLILKSFRSLSEKTANESLPPGSALLEWSPRPEDYTLDLSLSSDEWNTLLLFDGDRSLDTVLQMAPKAKTPATVTVYSLVSAGLVKKVRFRFPDLERICQEELGNMGLVLVRNAYQKVGVSRARMGMRELIRILNDLDKSMSLIVGPSRTLAIIDRLWEATKR